MPKATILVVDDQFRADLFYGLNVLPMRDQIRYRIDKCALSPTS